MHLNHVRAVVTGGASGLGFAVAQFLVANGGKVALFDVNAERGAAAVAVAAANVLAGEVALLVSEKIFEVMGARSATRANGFDRFWRNVRTHTLHNPAAYKVLTVGDWFLTGAYPEPGIFR